MNVTLPNGYTIEGVPEGTSKDEIMQKAIAAGYAKPEDFGQAETSPVEQPTEQPQGLGDRLEQRGDKFASDMAGVGEDMMTFNPAQTLMAGQRGIRRIGGAAAGAGADILGAGIVEAADFLTPEPVQDAAKSALKYVADSPVGKGIGSAARSVAEIYQGFKQGNPMLAQDIEDTANMAGVIPGVKGMQILGKAAKVPLDLIPQRASKQGIAKKLLEGSDDLSTTKFQIKEPSYIEKLFNTGAKIENSKTAKAALKQGIDEGIVHSIKASNAATKKKMFRMTNIMEKLRTKSALYGIDKRPTDVSGDSLFQRLKIVNDVKNKAGTEIDKVARSLKGEPVDIGKSVSEFSTAMKELGVTIDDNLKLGFKQSDIKRMAGSRNLLTDITERLSKMKNGADAYQVHKLKKFIDDNVTFGKVKDGLSGRSEAMIKDLRKSLDSKLDDTFPVYNKVNSTYSETIKGIKALQDVSGKKVDLMGERGAAALGRKLRGIMSNNVSRDNLIKASQDIEDLAKKYGGKFDDNISMQVLYADELDKIFKPVARTSLQGQMQQQAERGAMAGMSPIFTGLQEGGKMVDKMMGINQQGAFKALKNLLEDAN